MTTTDANGIVFYEETDPVSPLHTLLNAGQQSVSDAIGALNFSSGTYTPVVTGVSGTATGWWERIGDTVHVSIEVVLSGALTSFGVSVPVASAYPRHHGVGLAYLTDASGGGSSGRRIWTAYLIGSSLAVQDGTTGQVLSGSVPWTWASGDTISISATYQAA